MTEHTPGPWWQHDDGEKVYASVRDANGRCVADCGSRSDKDAQANARLIAAAPDLHDALVKLLKMFDGEIYNEYDGTSMLEEGLSEADFARDAIAKAQGPNPCGAPLTEPEQYSPLGND